jgi:hypothetical protein
MLINQLYIFLVLPQDDVEKWQSPKRAWGLPVGQSEDLQLGIGDLEVYAISRSPHRELKTLES